MFRKWYLLELNQGHMDFQSIALPPELRYQFCYIQKVIRSGFEPETHSLAYQLQFSLSECLFSVCGLDYFITISSLNLTQVIPVQSLRTSLINRIGLARRQHILIKNLAFVVQGIFFIISFLIIAPMISIVRSFTILVFRLKCI